MTRTSRVAGFSVLEVLIVIGIVACIALGAVSLVSSMSKVNKGVQFNSELNAFSDELRTLLSDIANCSTNFGALRRSGGLNPNLVTPLASLALAGGGIAFDTKSESAYVNRAVHIDSIEFGAPGTYAGTGASATAFQVPIRMRFSSVQEKQTSQREYRIWVKTNATGRIEQCSFGQLTPFSSERLADNGYIAFPNGFMMQWGRSTSNPRAVTTVVFPIAFRNKVFSVTLSGTDGPGTAGAIGIPALYKHGTSTNRNTFQVYSAGTGYDEFTWMAVGN